MAPSVVTGAPLGLAFGLPVGAQLADVVGPGCEGRRVGVAVLLGRAEPADGLTERPAEGVAVGQGFQVEPGDAMSPDGPEYVSLAMVPSS